MLLGLKDIYAYFENKKTHFNSTIPYGETVAKSSYTNKPDKTTYQVINCTKWNWQQQQNLEYSVFSLAI